MAGEYFRKRVRLGLKRGSKVNIYLLTVKETIAKRQPEI
jgi:hypothetical protein